MRTVTVVGLGYIGLPTALIAAQHNFLVTGYDVDHKRVAAINAADPVIEEPECLEFLQRVLATKAFTASTTMQPADYIIIAVPTPCTPHKKADLSCVQSALEAIVPVLRAGTVVILESTIPVGCTDESAAYLQQKTGLCAGKDFFVAHCPERVLPGKIFYELVHNARIIGGINQASCQAASAFYKVFVQGTLYLTSAVAAEMVKLVENSSRDVAIAFAHQVAAMAGAAGLNPYEVIELANKHPRVQIMQPSAGVGGHCIAIDPWFLIETFPEQTKLLHAARTVNEERPEHIGKKITHIVDAFRRNQGKNPSVLALGVTYKPNVDDLRESPALSIVQNLQCQQNCTVLVCDPYIDQEQAQAQGVQKVVSLTEGLLQADIVLGLVAHTLFKKIDPDLLADKQILDVCGLWYKVHECPQEQEICFWPTARQAQHLIHS